MWIYRREIQCRIFAGSGLAKCMKGYRDLKIANNLLSFETMALSERNNTMILAQAVRRSEAKKEILKSANLRIKPDKQGKHIKTHKNFRSEKVNLPIQIRKAL